MYYILNKAVIYRSFYIMSNISINLYIVNNMAIVIVEHHWVVFQ